MKKYFIAIVDDDRDDREIFEAAFSSNYDNIYFESFTNGPEFLSFINETADFPNVIVLDLSMPLMGGMEVLKTLKGNPKTAKIPVVILSGSKNHPDQQMANDLGAVYYFQKPVEIIEYSTIADKIIEKMNKDLMI